MSGMERSSRDGDFFRPPPTSPKGYRNKRARREGPPPRPQNDAEWSRPPPSVSPSLGRFQGREDAHESKPLHLGGYAIQHGPAASPEFKIRGRSEAPTKTEACNDEEPSFPDLQRTFLNAVTTIFDHVDEIGHSMIGSPRNHPAWRAILKIQDELDRLRNVHRSTNDGVESLMNELDGFASREDMLKNELGAARTVNFKLNCAKKELGDQVQDLKSTATKTEVELRRLKRDVEDLEAKREELERSRRELQEDRGKSGAERLWLEDTIRKRDAEIEKAAAENRRLQSLVEERDKQVEGLKSNNLGLQSLVRQRETQAEEARADNTRLQNLIREREAQISSLMALPITPLSPLGSMGPFSLPPAPGLPTSQPEQPVPSRGGSPPPFIKQEVPDQEAPVEASVAAEQPQDPAKQLHQLGAGAATILGKLFHIDHPLSNEVLAGFLTRLGAAPEAPAIHVTQGAAAGFWSFQDPWTPDFTPPKLQPSLEEQFAHLCLLFPFSLPGTTTTQPENRDDDPARFHLLTSLLTALIKADHSASRRAGLAFLQTMSAVGESQGRQSQTMITPATATATATATLTPRTALLSTLLCELCRALEAAFPHAPRRYQGWDVPVFFGGAGSAAEMEKRLPVARLAAALRDGDRSAGSARMLRERLAEACGAGYCWFRTTTAAGGGGGGGGSTTASPAADEAGGVSWDGDGEGGDGRKEMGLLHCGSDDFFLMIDFAERAFRVVDCRLAGMPKNAAEPRKFDLTIARPGPWGGEHDGGEELFRLAAAPRDVATFWLGYVYGDD